MRGVRRPHVVEPLTRRDCVASARVLAAAFRDNPGTLELLAGRSAEARYRLLIRAYLGFVEATRRCGDALVVRDGARVAAVSLSFAPDRYPPPLLGRVLMAGGVLSGGPMPAIRYARIGAYMERYHLARPHHYLFMLGVEPEKQGRGLGSALLGHLNERADRDAVECYLETDKASSVRLYERHGYEVTRDDRLQELRGLRFWTMTRPRANGPAS